MLSDLLKQDFINTLIDNLDYTKEEAENMWDSHGAGYLDAVYDFMTNEIYEISNEG